MDIDLDSINVIFGTALNNFSPAAYVPGVSPAPLTYETGFSPASPTPDASMMAGNVAAQVDPHSGELTFLNNMLGNYAIKLVVQTFRNGQLIAEIDRELQVVVLDCSSAPGSPNTAPDVTPPFAGSFETTVNAGDLVTFNFDASDIELLQDGTPQNNTLTASGLMFGTNFTSTSGCIIAPCATLDQPPPITGVQGASAQFSWQTDCN
ncbi:MAG TPA: hypothetical protein VEO92_01540, partial [Candidatus Nitrosocosmicus sp.]|nr:hypothetical protein [Candidatus Nitrosocosmicus sp.]